MTVATETDGASRYRPLRFHAKGGLGEVLLAEDGELGRAVALKRILPDRADDPDARGRFVLEAEITGRLEHPGIVPVYGLGADRDGRPCYAMRFIRGESLQSAAAKFHNDAALQAHAGRRNVALRRLLSRFVSVCRTVHYAHSRGVLHRDIKPANIMLGPYDETLVVDWGLAKVIPVPAKVGEAGSQLPVAGKDAPTSGGKQPSAARSLSISGDHGIADEGPDGEASGSVRPSDPSDQTDAATVLPRGHAGKPASAWRNAPVGGSSAMPTLGGTGKPAARHAPPPAAPASMPLQTPRAAAPVPQDATWGAPVAAPFAAADDGPDDVPDDAGPDSNDDPTLLPQRLAAGSRPPGPGQPGGSSSPRRRAVLQPIGTEGPSDPGGASSGDGPEIDGPINAVLAGGSSGGAAPTQMGATLGTPGYMPPEQAMGDLDRLGPAADVYALGATLHVLLTGRAPFEGMPNHAMLLRSSRGEFPAPRSVKPDVPAALEAVVLKCVRVRPEDRYPTADAIAADIESWLADEPVSAYPEPLLLRTRRWVRRHQTFAAGGVGLLATGLVATLVGLVLLDRQQAETEQQRSAAESARAQAETARTTAETRRAEAEAERRRADLAAEVADGRRRDAESARKDADVQRAEALAQSARAEKNFQRARAAVDEFLTKVSENRLLNEPGQHAFRKDLLGAALKFYQDFVRDRGDDPKLRQELADAWGRMARILAITGKPDEAVAAYRRQLDIQARQLEAPDSDGKRLLTVADARQELGVVLRDLWMIEDALSEFAEAENIRDRAVAAGVAVKPGQRVRAWEARAAALIDAGRIGEASAALDVARRLSPRSLNVFNQGSLALGGAGRPDDALGELKKALTAVSQARFFKPDELELKEAEGVLLNNAAMRYMETGRLRDAVVHFRRAVKVYEDLALSNPGVPRYMDYFAALLGEVGRLYFRVGLRERGRRVLADALKYHEVLNRDDTGYPEFGWQHAIALRTGARMHHLLGEGGKGAGDADRAVAILEALRRKHPRIEKVAAELIDAMLLAADIREGAGKTDEADDHRRRALELARGAATAWPEVPLYGGYAADARLAIARQDVRAGRFDEAKTLLDEVAADAKRLAGDYKQVAWFRRLAAEAEYARAMLAAARRAKVPGGQPSDAAKSEAESLALEVVARLKAAADGGHESPESVRSDPLFAPLLERADVKGVLEPWEAAIKKMRDEAVAPST